MEWISVEDKLPEENEYVLLCIDKTTYEKRQKNISDGPRIFVGYRGNYSSEEYDSAYGDGYIPFEYEDITHWTKLPNFPEKES